MKLQELTTQMTEMTLYAPRMNEHELANAFDRLVDIADQFTHTGDMEHINVLHKDDIYLFKDSEQDKFVGFAQVHTQNGDALIQNIYLIPEYRGKEIFAWFLWFLKTREDYSRIVLGEVHSKDTIKALRRAHKKFETYWEKDGQRHKFDPDTAAEFYGNTEKTGWRVVLENRGDFSDWPRYNVANSGPYDAMMKGYGCFMEPLNEDE